MKKLDKKLEIFDLWIFQKVEKSVLKRLEKKGNKGKHKYNLLKKYFEWQVPFYLISVFVLYPTVTLFEDSKHFVFGMSIHFFFWIPLAFFTLQHKNKRLKSETKRHEIIWALRHHEEFRGLYKQNCDYMFKTMKNLRIMLLKFQIPLTLIAVAFLFFVPFLATKILGIMLISEHIYSLYEQYIIFVNDIGEGGTREKAKAKVMTNIQISSWKKAIAGMNI